MKNDKPEGLQDAVGEVIDRVERHNQWRQGGNESMTDPRTLTEDLDTLIIAAKENTTLKQEISDYSISLSCEQARVIALLDIVRAEISNQENSAYLKCAFTGLLIKMKRLTNSEGEK